MDHPNAEVREHPRFGKGVYASAFIPANTEIASFDGEIFHGEINDDFPREVMNYVISFAPDRGRNSAGIARFLNHSCSPNTGIRGLFTLVTMRDVQKAKNSAGITTCRRTRTGGCHANAAARSAEKNPGVPVSPGRIPPEISGASFLNGCWRNTALRGT